MRGRLFNALCLLSLVLAVAMAALWARSAWWATDFWNWRLPGRQWIVSLTSDSRGLGVGIGYDRTGWGGVLVLEGWWTGTPMWAWGLRPHADWRPGSSYFPGWALHVTVPYPTLIALAWIGPAAWGVMRFRGRGRRRREAGLCAACGYDLRGLPRTGAEPTAGPACPECGEPTTAST